MSKPTYPELGDLQGALDDAGLSAVAPSSDALSAALSSAVAQLERDADWHPFLASSEETTRKFSILRQQRLFLESGLVEAPSRLRFGGNELTLDVNFFLEPVNALEQGKPFTRVNFCFKRSSAPNGIEITGRWGACDELPDDVWSGVIALAAWNLRGELQRRWNDSKVAEQNAAGLVKAKESGPLRVEFAVVDSTKVIDLSATFGAWRGTYDAALDGRVMRLP